MGFTFLNYETLFFQFIENIYPPPPRPLFFILKHCILLLIYSSNQNKKVCINTTTFSLINQTSLLRQSRKMSKIGAVIYTGQMTN